MIYRIYNLTIADENVCLRVVALLQFFGGCYWIVPPIWKTIAQKEDQQKPYAAVRHRKIYTALTSMMKSADN